MAKLCYSRKAALNGGNAWGGAVKAGSHSSVMQVFGAPKRATTLMLDVQPDGAITYYDTPDAEYKVIRTGMNERWFNLKVKHDADARGGMGEIRVYIDDVLSFTV